MSNTPHKNNAPHKSIAAAIIAGGQSSRMGGREKCLLPLADGTVLDTILSRLSAQVEIIVINSNRDPSLYLNFNIPVIPDTTNEPAGPLAGVLSALDWLTKQGHRGWLLTVPSDTPFLPMDLVDRLYSGIQGVDTVITYAHSARPHFLTALWPMSIHERLNLFFLSGGRAVKDFFATCNAVEIHFPSENIDPFFNINTPEDYQLAKRSGDSYP